MDNAHGVPTADFLDGGGGMSEAELADALGEPAPEPEPEPEQTAPEPTAEAPELQWVHEPTGKAFETELELLRYESGWKDNKYGTENKELMAKLEAYNKILEGSGESQSRPQLTPQQQEELILKKALEGTGVDLDNVDAGAYKTIVKMVENMLGLYDGNIVEKRLAELAGKVEKITTRAQQAEALNTAGITIDQVQEVLEKRPYLKKLDIGEQTAVIADLVKAQAPKQGTGESPNALRQALQPKTANHVEGSAGLERLDAGEAALEAEFEKKLDGNDRDFLRALGKATAQAGPMPWMEDGGWE